MGNCTSCCISSNNKIANQEDEEEDNIPNDMKCLGGHMLKWHEPSKTCPEGNEEK